MADEQPRKRARTGAEPPAPAEGRGTEEAVAEEASAEGAAAAEEEAAAEEAAAADGEEEPMTEVAVRSIGGERLTTAAQEAVAEEAVDGKEPTIEVAVRSIGGEQLNKAHSKEASAEGAAAAAEAVAEEAVEEEEPMIEVAVRSIDGEQLTTAHVPLASSVLEVKQWVEWEFGYPAESQRLLLQDGIVQEDTLLSGLPSPLAFTLVLLPFSRESALDRAIMDGHETAVRSLLQLDRSLFEEEEERPDMLLVDTNSVVWATRQGHYAICQLLLEAAPSADVREMMLRNEDCIGGSALYYAAEEGDAWLCQLLLDAAPDGEVRRAMLEAMDGFDFETAFHCAATWGHDAVCRTLLEAVPSPEACGEILGSRCRSGATALDLAVSRGHEGVSQMLLDATMARRRD